MPCPACGGMAREPVAPGYWRCVSQRVDLGPGPNPSGPPQLGPRVTEYVTICGHQYMEGPVQEAPLCSCGTFSIGICASCGQPVCGDCSEIVDGRRTCRRHGIEARREATRKREQERAGRLAPLAEIDDPIERLLRGVLLLEKLYGPERFRG